MVEDYNCVACRLDQTDPWSCFELLWEDWAEILQCFKKNFHEVEEKIESAAIQRRRFRKKLLF